MHVPQPDIDSPTREFRPTADADGDWMRVWSDTPEVLKIEAFFRGASYGMHRHDTYAVGMTTFGVQSIRYRGRRIHGKPGETVVIYPDELAP